MTYGLQVFNASGVKTFDSTQAMGGVCLGFYTVPGTGGTYTFTDITGANGGMVMPHALYNWAGDYTISVSPHLSFTFPSNGQVRKVALFAT